MVLFQVIPFDVGKKVKVLVKVSSKLNWRWINWDASLKKEQLCPDSSVCHFGDLTVNVKVKVKWCYFEHQRKHRLEGPPGLQSGIFCTFLWKFKNTKWSKGIDKRTQWRQSCSRQFWEFSSFSQISSLTWMTLLVFHRWYHLCHHWHWLSIVIFSKHTKAIIPDHYQEKPTVVSAYDFIVVGAGSSGFVIITLKRLHFFSWSGLW